MNQAKIIIRPAAQEHLEPACQLAVAAWTPIREIFRQEIGSELYRVFFADWQAQKCQDVTQELSSGRGFVALSEGRLAGFISYRLDKEKKTALIGTNAVSAAWRGQGIGSQLYQYILDLLQAEGIRYVNVTTGLDEGHAAARRAYSKAGFSLHLPIISYYQKIAAVSPVLPDQLEITPARPEHLPAAFDIATAAWTGIHAEYEKLLGAELHEAFFGGWQARKHQAISSELLSGRGFVALYQGRPAGFISYAMAKDAGFGSLGNNAVHSDLRGRGIGGLLYSHVLACLEKEGIRYAKVTTGLDDSHAPARRAYSKAGFSVGLPSISYYQKLES